MDEGMVMGKPKWETGKAAQMWRVRQEAIARRWAEQECKEAARQMITLAPDQYAERKDGDE